MSLLEAIEAGNVERLKWVVKSWLRKIADADWPELYQLHTACMLTNDRSGRELIYQQLPSLGDRTLAALSVRHLLYMELVRVEYLNERGVYDDAHQLAALVRILAARAGATEIERVANEYQSRRTQ